jgi:hypothetical protein
MKPLTWRNLRVIRLIQCNVRRQARKRCLWRTDVKLPVSLCCTRGDHKVPPLDRHEAGVQVDATCRTNLRMLANFCLYSEEMHHLASLDGRNSGVISE